MRRLRILAAWAMLTWPGCALAASLEGTVADRLGKAVAGARIVILAAGVDDEPLMALSDGDGRWAQDGLSDGIYRVLATKLGYASEVRDAVRLAPDDQVRLDFTLTPAQVASESGRKDLTWLVRGLAGDALRSPGPSAGVSRGAGPDETSHGLPVSGRVSVATLGGAGSSAAGDVGGNQADLSLSGRARADVHWYVDGSLGAHSVASSGVQDALQADQLSYGLSLDRSRSTGTLSFEGRLERLNRHVTLGEDTLADGSEAMASYTARWQRRGDSGNVRGVELDYRVAQAGTGTDLDSHALLTARGVYAGSPEERQSLVASVELATQSYTRPLSRALFVAAGNEPLLVDGTTMIPAAWTLRAAGAERFRVSEVLTLSPGLDLFEAAGQGLGEFLQPHFALALKLDAATTVGGDVAYAWNGPDLGQGHGQMAYGLTMDRALGRAGRLSLAARLNGHRQATADPGRVVEGSAPDFLLLAGGGVASRELSVGLETAVGEILSGRLHAVVGTAQGDLLLLPLASRVVDRSPRELGSSEVSYIETAVGTTVHRTATDLDLSWLWTTGLTAAAAAAAPGEDAYGRLDLRLRQPLPFAALDVARIQLLINMRSYFSRPLLLSQGGSAGVADLDPVANVFTGGVAIVF